MNFWIKCHILLGVIALLQFSCSYGKRQEKDQALMLQKKVENLIEKILRVIQDYYNQIRTELKCIPDEVPDTIISTLKKSIDCVDQNERNYDSGRITSNMHKKNFLKCFSDAKTEVEETITSINPNLDYCPENMTEKTYQINVTTTFTKTFHINIKNGLEIIKKKVHMGNEEQICVFNQGELSDKVNQTSDNHGSDDNMLDEDKDYDEDERKDKGHLSKEKEHESKEHHGKGHESKDHHGKGHESKDHHGKGHESKDHHGKGHESKEHHGKDQNLVDKLVEDNNAEVILGKDHKSKEQPIKGQDSKEHKGKGHESKEQPGKVHDSKEQPVKGHHSKEQPGKDHESKEQPGKVHDSKDHHGKDHESKEQPGKVHDSKEHHGKDHESKEQPGKGHHSKEHPGNDNSGEVFDVSANPSDSWTEDEFVQETGHEVSDYDDEKNGYDDSESHPDEDLHSKEHHGNGPASKEHLGVDSDSGSADDDDDDDGDTDDDQDAFFNVDDFDDESGDQISDSSDADNYDNENESSQIPDSAQDSGKESQTEEHHTVSPDSKELHGKGHESKDYSDKGSSSEYYEQTDDDDDDDDYATADNAGDDEDEDFSNESDHNTVNGNVDDAIEIKNKTKEKNLLPSIRPIADDDNYDNDDSGVDDEKIFFPETMANIKVTTQSSTKLATELATERPSDPDYYADPDVEPEDTNYGNEYYDTPEKETNLTHSHNPAESLDHTESKLGQIRPTEQAKSNPRIKIKPRNQFKQKPKKQHNNERLKIKLPKTPANKIQPEIAPKHQAATSLSQSFLQSDF